MFDVDEIKSVKLRPVSKASLSATLLQEILDRKPLKPTVVQEKSLDIQDKLILELSARKPLRKLPVDQIPHRIGGNRTYTTQKYYKDSRLLVDIFKKHASEVKMNLTSKYSTLSKIKHLVETNEAYKSHLKQIKCEANMKYGRLLIDKLDIEQRVREDSSWRNLMYEIRRTKVSLLRVVDNGYYVMRKAEIETPIEQVTWFQYVFGKW